MCCEFPKDRPNVTIESIKHLPEGKHQVKGQVNFAPKPIVDKLLRFFRRLELVESFTEMLDGGCDLFGKLFQAHANQHILDKLHDLHEGAHALEEVLHALCFFGALTRIATGQFVEYHDKQKKNINYISTIARACLTGSHLGATIGFVVRMTTGANNYLVYTKLVLNITGYTLLSVSAIWKRVAIKHSHHFKSDLSIYLSGLTHDITPLLKEIQPLKPFAKIVRSLAHLVHGFFKATHLMPSDMIKFTAVEVAKN